MYYVKEERAFHYEVKLILRIGQVQDNQCGPAGVL